MSRSDFSGVIEGERLLMVQLHNTLTHALVYFCSFTGLRLDRVDGGALGAFMCLMWCGGSNVTLGQRARRRLATVKPAARGRHAKQSVLLDRPVRALARAGVRAGKVPNRHLLRLQANAGLP